MVDLELVGSRSPVHRTVHEKGVLEARDAHLPDGLANIVRVDMQRGSHGALVLDDDLFANVMELASGISKVLDVGDIVRHGREPSAWDVEYAAGPDEDAGLFDQLLADERLALHASLRVLIGNGRVKVVLGLPPDARVAAQVRNGPDPTR